MAAPHSGTASWQRYFFIYATICLVVASLYFGHIIILPIVLSILIAFILIPLVTWLQKHGLHRIISVGLVVLLGDVHIHRTDRCGRLPGKRTRD